MLILVLGIPFVDVNEVCEDCVMNAYFNDNSDKQHLFSFYKCTRNSNCFTVLKQLVHQMSDKFLIKRLRPGISVRGSNLQGVIGRVLRAC